MYLSTVQLLGFKSFADRAELTVLPGLSAIVGPPDCGKTNLLEAIRWALGESPSMLRRGDPEPGLIFRGTHRRAPMQQATVSLVFSDCPAGWSLPGHQLRITRQVGRSGSDLHTGQNGAIDAAGVANLLARADIKPANCAFDADSIRGAALTGSLLLLDQCEADFDDDEAQTYRELIAHHRSERQLLVVTNDKHTMAQADTCYGITMEEWGVSRPVPMRLTGAPPNPQS